MPPSDSAGSWSCRGAVGARRAQQSVAASVHDLLSEDVGVSCMLGELAKHLKLQGPHHAMAAAVNGILEGRAQPSSDSLDVRDVLAQTEQCGPRRHETHPSLFFFAEPVERVVQRRPVAVDQLIETSGQIRPPPISTRVTRQIGHTLVLPLPTRIR